MNWYVKVLKQYTDFSGRARRKEFWIFTLINIIIGWILLWLDNLMGFDIVDTTYGVRVGILYLIYALFLTIPTIAVTVRRLHDTGRSGWWWFLWFIPIIGGIWIFILMILDSEPGTNEYGPNPKGVESVVA